jgi:UDP-N-acetylmuramate: L-alanyl-gamma-D-glutamyl-meso-diaminopimelate ligase
VVEGDEYDSAFFEKTPKFWSYRPSGPRSSRRSSTTTSTSTPTRESYRDAFGASSRASPRTACSSPTPGRRRGEVAKARVPRGVLRASRATNSRGCHAHVDGGAHRAQGGAALRALHRRLVRRATSSRRSGRAQPPQRDRGDGARLPRRRRACPSDLMPSALRRFQGRQAPPGAARRGARVRVYDDFAHHPTAVERRDPPRGVRGATACRTARGLPAHRGVRAAQRHGARAAARQGGRDPRLARQEAKA